MSATPAAKVTWTYDDYRQMPDDGNRYEVIDGDLLVTPSPSTAHQTVSKRLLLVLMLELERPGIALVFNAPTDVIFSKVRCVVPDLLAVKAARRGIVTRRGIEGPPDLVVEIVSPSTEAADRSVKAKLYASEGVREYWIADPDTSSIEVHVWREDGFQLAGRYGPGDRLSSVVFDLAFDVDPIYAP